MNYKADYLKAIVDCARVTMIEQQANESAKKYRNLSNTARGVAAELRKKEKEKRDAKDKGEQDSSSRSE